MTRVFWSPGKKKRKKSHVHSTFSATMNRRPRLLWSSRPEPDKTQHRLETRKCLTGKTLKKNHQHEEVHYQTGPRSAGYPSSIRSGLVFPALLQFPSFTSLSLLGSHRTAGALFQHNTPSLLPQFKQTAGAINGTGSVPSESLESCLLQCDWILLDQEGWSTAAVKMKH